VMTGAGTSGGSFNWVSLLVGLALMAASAYVFRGKGAAAALDTWEAMQEKRREDAEKREEAQKAQRRKERADFVSTILGRAPRPIANGDDAVAAAQVAAIANPETARAIQNLQNLLYTQAITDQEFQAAKDRLLRSSDGSANTDVFAQVLKLAELHEAGVLNDSEFSASKLRLLGLG